MISIDDICSCGVAKVRPNELPSKEAHLRSLTQTALECFTGIREYSLTHIQLKDIEFVWMQSELSGCWVPGVLIDYRNMKFHKDPFVRR